MCYKKYFSKISPILLFLLFALICCTESTESTESNNSPYVNSITAFPDPVQVSDSFAVFVSAKDVDGDPLTYDWFCTN